MPCPPPRDLPNPGIKPKSHALQVDSLPSEPAGKPKNTGVVSPSLPQGIFPTQELSQGLLLCRWILYQLSYQGSPSISMCYVLISLVMSNSLIPYGLTLPGSSVHGVLQTRTLEWVSMLSSRGSSQPGIEPVSLMSSALVGGFFTTSTTYTISISISTSTSLSICCLRYQGL